MEFITFFPRTSRKHDFIMVIVDNLTKVVHFILVTSTYSTNFVVEAFIIDVVRLHVVLKKIVSDEDANFTSSFLKELFASLGTNLAFGTSYHR